MRVSVCIPTYNRAGYLANCLQSIIANKTRSTLDFQVVVSDNCSTDETEKVVQHAQENLDIKYQRNPKNLGIPRNFLKVIDMADGEFVWLIGDDDLLLPSALEELNDLLDGHPTVDFFYINSFHLTTQYVLSFPQPFNTSNLPSDMTPFSSWTHSGEMRFFDLVNPDISFDFLGGMFLSVFRRKSWLQNVNALDEAAILDSRTFSFFDNTFPHVKIFAKAFANSRAYFSAKPLSVCLAGAREWAPMYPLVRSVRLVEAVDEYRKNGLSFQRFLRCKNYALSYFIPDIVAMLINKERSGFRYIRPWKLFLGNCLYPNCYLSFFYYFARKLKAIVVNRRYGKQ